MTIQEVQFLWVGLLSGFMFGVVATVIGLLHLFDGSWAGGTHAVLK
jgi:hypothetical protein